MTTDELRAALERIKELGGPVDQVFDHQRELCAFVYLRGMAQFPYFEDGVHTPHSAWLIIGALMEDLHSRELDPELVSVEGVGWEVGVVAPRQKRFVSQRAANPLEAVIKTYIRALEAVQSDQ